MRAKYFRDAFFILTGTGVLVDQLPPFSASAQPILVFLGLFLLGCAPALHMDEEGGSPLIKLLLSLLGGMERKDSKKEPKE